MEKQLAEQIAHRFANDWPDRSVFPRIHDYLQDSLRALAPDGDVTAAVDTSNETPRLLLLKDRALFSISVSIDESEGVVCTIERTNVGPDAVLTVRRHPFSERGPGAFDVPRRMHDWRLTIPSSNKTVEFRGEVAHDSVDRGPNATQQLGYALAALLGWRIPGT